MSPKKLHQSQMPVAKAALAPNIPEELTVDILLRLPAKSIGKFSIYTLTFTTADKPGSEAVLEKLTLSENILENPSSKYASIVGSCNGLVLVLGFRRELGLRDTMYLINPTTMEVVKLAASPLVRKAVLIGGALGYDSSNDDYKIVTVSCDDSTGNETSVDVFSLRSGSWKRINSLPYHLNFCSWVFLNGAIHWLACSDSDSEDYSVIAFDLTSEKFDPVPIPRGEFDPIKLVDLGGCLAIVVKQTYHQMDIWVMQEYGIGQSWTKFSVATPNSFYLNKVVCLLGDDNVVVLNVEEQKFVVHNLTENTRRDMVVAGIGGHLRQLIGFSESLVSPIYYCQNWRAT
ncbi:F-box/kelch-repeat protein At3g06240-like isoform X2 [Coffea arabica]|uniref:F-box/kelch-repeat protein At3g06240-like isoform X2 n=1 Tax=Coffea arabica TaxID=13443 RepID=A0A6P6X6Y7_COFAR|nr:F-box/kelch-repeat protein At3g06240-like isoform X2 [Coffea arabica]XP_027124785.1 F-box/kelch-repeat protein At3g06240-like isoform X2 [Coffea arabica]